MTSAAIALGQTLIMFLIAMWIIKWACDQFGEATDFLSTHYNLRPGIKGLINSIGSSKPEFWATLIMLFFYGDVAGFAAGVATCAGSAIFNAAIIPALCIIVVTRWGVNGQKIKEIPLNRDILVRDGLFFIGSETALIFFLSFSVLPWWVGLALIAIYGIYFYFATRNMFADGEQQNESNEDGSEDPEEDKYLVWKILTLDFKNILFNDALTPKNAWILIAVSTIFIGGACHLLVESVMIASHTIGIAAYFTAVILAAAGTSVPDTILSVRDARKGDYDDAITNAIGSNIFDICIALGVPLLLYGVVNAVKVSMGISVVPVMTDSNVQELRIVLIIISATILGLFLTGKKGVDNTGSVTVSVTEKTGWCLLGLYAAWLAFIVVRATMSV